MTRTKVIKTLIPTLFKMKKATISIAILFSVILLGAIGPLTYKVDPFAMTGPPSSPPSSKYPLGTDAYGRDLLAQLIRGIGGSIFIGVISAVISLVIAVPIGVISGFKGGNIDEALKLGTNVMLTLPSILIMMLVAAFLEERNPIYVALIIGLTSWPWVAVAVRSQTLSLKTREFIYMSRMAGFGDVKIAFLDVLPHMASYVFMSFIMLMSGGMLAEAGLSMIGLGVTRGASLGIMLFWAQILESVRRGLFWWFIPPGAILVIITSSLMMLTTALDEYFSPRLRGA